MLYSEFVEGTGCRETDYNYKVYRRLEIVYMNDESMTKEEVYEWGKKIVDNSLTEEEKEHNRGVKEAIAGIECLIEDAKADKERYKEYARTSCDADDKRFWCNAVKDEQASIRRLREQVKWQRSILIK